MATASDASGDSMSLPGSMDQRPSGHWRVRVKLASGERISHHFATEEEALRFRRGLAALEATKPTLATGPQTLETMRARVAALRPLPPDADPSDDIPF